MSTWRCPECNRQVPENKKRGPHVSACRRTAVAEQRTIEFAGSDLELAWLSGLYEGEGSVRWTPKAGAEISIGMTDKDIIERVVNLLPGSKLFGPYTHGDRKPMWYWRVNGIGKVQCIVRLLWPYLGERRKQQASAVFASYSERQHE